MSESRISLRRLPYDDTSWNIDLHATNGRYSAALEFYSDPRQLRYFAERLTSFGGRLSDDARLEFGSGQENTAYQFLIRAYCWDAAGHAAVEILLDNKERAPYGARANFHILCDAASINRFGGQLHDWSQSSVEPLVWMA
jgi:hypothetical protein